MRAAKEVTERGTGQYIELLNCQKRPFQKVEQTNLSPPFDATIRTRIDGAVKGLTGIPGIREGHASECLCHNQQSTAWQARWHRHSCLCCVFPQPANLRQSRRKVA